MSETTVVLTLKKGRIVTKVEGTRVTFSAHQCFRFDDSPTDVECLSALGRYLKTLPGLALFQSGRFLDYLLKHVPELKAHVECIVCHGAAETDRNIHGLATVRPHQLPPKVRTVFLCETLTVPRMRMKKLLPPSVSVVEPTVLAEIAPEAVPARGWIALPRNIYPIEIPQVQFKQGMDLIIVDCPARNLALMPNGLAYVSNALKKTSVAYQIFDLDIVAYHQFHVHRLFDVGGRIVLPSGRVLPEDPWQAEHYDVWTSGAETASSRRAQNDVLEFFRPLIEETISGLVDARPKVLGLSIQQCNEGIAREIARGVKAQLPDIIVLVGGFSCYNADIGRRAFPECDYMCVGEADLTVGPLVEALARGERPFNMPGVLSRFDTQDYRFIPAPMVHNLDQIEFPKYEWTDLGLYRNYDGYQLTPIIASRGCRWSRCTFCAERFYWRIRSPQNFVDELQWLVDRGCYLFMFNESDLNGMPERLLEICDEIIRRGLHRKVKLTGQLRIHKKSNRAFFEKLRAANFVALRFGVDAFSENTLRLQKKGYTVDMISQNLKDCWESGIFTEVNWVIGVPGETDADVEEGIKLILKNRKYIGRIANINPLILVNGSVYWIDPEAHNIRFREPKEELYAKFPRALPADSWYSIEPYIDAQVRKERFERIVLALHDAGFPIGAWAERVIEDVKLARDPNRAASAKRLAEEGQGPRDTVVLGDSGWRAPPPEERADERRVIPIEAAYQKGGGKEDSRPAAESPLNCAADEPPRVVRRMKNHTIVFHNGWYYGIPNAPEAVDLTDFDSAKIAGGIKHATEEGVVALIEETSRWANTRGQYDSQEQQRAAGSLMRADSALGEIRVRALPEKPMILRYRDEYIAINKEELKDAFGMGRRIGLRGRTGEVHKREAVGVKVRSSLLRRVAAKLPPSVYQEIKRLIHMQSFKSGAASGLLATASDGRLLFGMLVRGAVDHYVKRPIARILNGGERHRTRKAEEIPVTGTDFFIVSAVTKNAVPELMWTIENYNVVKFDGMFYGLPHGVPVDWEAGDVASIPGVFTGRTVQEVVSIIESNFKGKVQDACARAPAVRAIGPAGEATTVPLLLGSIEGHNIVSYEGWIYGIPQSLGPVDLTEVDVMKMPGVIRDVSRDVVENEILDRVRAIQRAA
jgi:radical SAM superfamily enzyme YgiQ (UPF0313 family)